jgi:uncharacterized protein DUF3106
MKPKIPITAILLLGALTTGLFAPAALSRDHGNGHDQQARNGDVPWDDLTGDEQSTLKDYRHNWQRYSPAEQNKLRQGARRYLDLPPGQREAVRRKQQQYRNMSPQERQQLREKYRREQD